MTTYRGLTHSEVEKRIAQNQVNTLPKPEIRTNREIIFSHVFTLFNLYNIIIATALLWVGAYTSLFFMGIVFSNTIMFTIQEIRSRNLVQKLNILVAPKTHVIRDGEKILVDNEQLVLDDCVVYEAGDQISADAIILSGSIEVNESLLTGEIDPVDKKTDSELLSGSFVVSGTCIAKVIHVGTDNYAIQVTAAIKKQKKNNSELLKAFRKVTRLTSFFIIPVGFVLLYQGFIVRQDSTYDVIVNTSTALLGMLPQGLVLLTTVSLIGGVLKLGSKKTLVQDIYAIEKLAQADVLCLDKTGTLTLGEMRVMESLDIEENALAYMKNYIHYVADNNATAHALYEYFKPEKTLPFEDVIPFSSSRKWGALLGKDESLILGAPDILLPGQDLPELMNDQVYQGARVIVLTKTSEPVAKDKKLPMLSPLMWIAIQDPLREDAHEAIDFFTANSVQVKIISGDNPITVGVIARNAGVIQSMDVIDGSSLETREDLENAIMNYNVIGRATPNQKLAFTEILQSHHLKVAMTGDGINDVLALKNADCSIAMGEGSDAALSISQIVIMDGKLSTLVDVVKEGRQVINSITLSASMYYLRTIMSIFMALTALAMNVPFPFIPFQITLSNMFIDGFPSFMILFERHIEKPKERILHHVLRHSVPNAMAIIVVWVGLNIYAEYNHIAQNTVQTIMFYVTAYISLHLIYRIFKPLNWYRSIVLILDVIGFAIAILIFWNWLRLVSLSPDYIRLTLILTLIANILVYIILWLVNLYFKFRINHEEAS